ncbi:hypothetical protein GCM10010320_81650 [Streptomyces caelestis]|nr:hypothetical protein GCM10010320_81650 [Streptomyces caelestis]
MRTDTDDALLPSTAVGPGDPVVQAVSRARGTTATAAAKRRRGSVDDENEGNERRMATPCEIYL